jgi:hypothetical protein
VPEALGTGTSKRDGGVKATQRVRDNISKLLTAFVIVRHSTGLMMPALTKIKLSRSEEYWNTLDHGNMKQVLEAIMTEVISNQPELTARRANNSPYHPSTT